MENDSSYGPVLRSLKRQSSKGDAGLLSARPALRDVLLTRPADPAGTGFVLSMLSGASGPILWVQDHASRRENGSLYMPGLAGFGIDQPVLWVTVSHPRDVLWTMEEGAACASLSAVVGEIHGAPAVLDFTATKRLALRAEHSGVSVYLIRSGDPGGLSAARERWRIGALPSPPHPDDSQSPGQAQWDADMFRARGRPPGRWVAHYDPGAKQPADRLCLVSCTDAGTLDQSDQPIQDRARA